MKSILAPIILLATLLFTNTALACSFNMDCSVGSKCLKSSGSLYGVCVGGMFPGNSNDKQPVYAPLDLDGTTGNTCSFNMDCGIKNKCIKSSGSIYGTCM